ncbi:hypothetical protein TRFO_40378 [Tritrichomonas foetus]|uniref:Uncharacterized protein n=1 Tax=Tritrichomonas foetus TaxID=1144522 RepID=A0A1J4J7B1_9EUKA|nr:hypothetical protein TRFO_40378 [Tritrichomonas foetus]|eukprot:OHS93341.1 hypothetical protein TRFO_40378 [Tritrichomonas foetus]
METFPLDLVSLLLPVVVHPIEIPFNSLQHSVIDHHGHIFSVSVKEGVGIINSGSPVQCSPIKYDRKITTPCSDSNDESNNDSNHDDSYNLLNALTKEIKKNAESVNDFKIDKIVFHWGLKKGHSPFLLDCDGSTFCPRSEFIKSNFQAIHLFIAQESNVQVIANQCITRGKCCLGGTQSIQRNYIVASKLNQLIDFLEISEHEAVFRYLKKHISKILPSVMLTNVPVCANCFNFYMRMERISKNMNFRAKSQNVTPRLRKSANVKLPSPLYEVNMRTQSGLNYMTNHMARNTDKAKKLYRMMPISRPKPPPFERNPARKLYL